MRSSLKRQVGLALIVGFVIFVSLTYAFPVSAQECDDERLEFGAVLYSVNCAVCHGIDGQGRVGATLAKDWPSIRPDLRVRETIVNGGPDLLMPAWSNANGGPLNDVEIDALVCYILSWQSGGPPFISPKPTHPARIALTPPPGVSGDPNNGAYLYSLNCAVCHGLNGEGRIGAPLAKDWPSIRPDLRVKSVIESGVEGSPMPAWSQDNGGPLTQGEIDDTVAYILTFRSSPSPTILETPETTEGPIRGWPAWVLVILMFVAVLVAIVYFSRKPQTED